MRRFILCLLGCAAAGAMFAGNARAASVPVASRWLPQFIVGGFAAGSLDAGECLSLGGSATASSSCILGQTQYYPATSMTIQRILVYAVAVAGGGSLCTLQLMVNGSPAAGTSVSIGSGGDITAPGAYKDLSRLAIHVSAGDELQVEESGGSCTGASTDPFYRIYGIIW